jgi:hypothetical protein
MTPPERYSVSPLPSYVTIRSPTFAEIVRDLWRWLRRDKATMTERQVRDAVVNRLAKEFDSDQQGQ